VKIKRNYTNCPGCNKKISISTIQRHLKGMQCGKRPYTQHAGNNCNFCNKEILNKGSLIAHIKCCKLNPNRVPSNRSSNAGRKKGCVAWNKGIKNNNISKSIALIEEGDYKNLNEGTIRKHVKRYLIAKNGHMCSICNISEWNNQPVPLICDHIDGNSTNVVLNNFRIVCCNCDAQLPTYKSKNRGKGRSYDKFYYHNKRKLPGWSRTLT
jgi:hypothetical protein